MIKRIALSSLFCLFSIIMMAVPAKPGLWRSITLTDGTVVRAQLMGDEFTHWWQDADGNQYVLNQTSGRFSKKTVDATAGLAKRRKAQAAVARQAARRAASGSLFKGQKRGLIILAQFPNSKFSMNDPQAFFNRFANEIGFHDGNFQEACAITSWHRVVDSSILSSMSKVPSRLQTTTSIMAAMSMSAVRVRIIAPRR